MPPDRRDVLYGSLGLMIRRQLRAEEAARQHATGIVARFLTIQEES
jgi:hypothetical protein